MGKFCLKGDAGKDRKKKIDAKDDSCGEVKTKRSANPNSKKRKLEEETLLGSPKKKLRTMDQSKKSQKVFENIDINIYVLTDLS